MQFIWAAESFRAVNVLSYRVIVTLTVHGNWRSGVTADDFTARREAFNRKASDAVVTGGIQAIRLSV